MPIAVTIVFASNQPSTVYNALKARLGREPSRAELIHEVKRILSGAAAADARAAVEASYDAAAADARAAVEASHGAAGATGE